MDVSIRLEGKNKVVNIENAAVPELMMLMNAIADEVGLASFNDETQVQALTRYIDQLKELQSIVKSIKETEKPKRASFTGEELKRVIKLSINDFVFYSDDEDPEIKEKNIPVTERKRKFIIADADELFDTIAVENICDDSCYEPKEAVILAAKITCEYMWRR